MEGVEDRAKVCVCVWWGGGGDRAGGGRAKGWGGGLKTKLRGRNISQS